MTIYDISLPLVAGLAEWPGDAPYRLERTARLDAGDTVNLGRVEMSVHFGTHIDAPYHFLSHGATVEQLDMNSYIGPALVVDVRGKSLIRREDLAHIALKDTPRLLLKTAAWTDHTRFPETVPVLDTDVPAWLKAQGVILIGLDVPSVDAIDSKDLPTHHALAECGIAILEGLDLAEVPEGCYELIALPLKLVGADGAPVRAILRSLE